ncbi:SDR family NAD(P)-dependent oxidoreductase [Bradyrhizobium sp. LHD-71]|uniref:SDR family NAD(P)-dependent oxidoreductase n=1 Tax=Bradyrhizobium sp. LHD-71 TaxID=3072141 RepID=UPI00280FB0E2|nr:SDR family NAD(P)-dependent oxidoreductase [Bradyrhizobium sp. LHD-71]MDQ8728178.1 SDR family NAD(P)-dependent oxidoreductase [Bradyrhizobium sp. LHD-71]
MAADIKRQRSAIVIGVGAEQGLGAGLAERFSREGFRVFIAGQSLDGLVRVAQNIVEAGGDVVPIVTDATIERELVSLFDYADDGGSLEVIAFDAGEGVRYASNLSPVQLFEHAWRCSARRR